MVSLTSGPPFPTRVRVDEHNHSTFSFKDLWFNSHNPWLELHWVFIVRKGRRPLHVTQTLKLMDGSC